MSGKRSWRIRCGALVVAWIALGCGAEAPEPAPQPAEPVPQGPDRAELRKQALSVFGPLPTEVERGPEPVTDAQVELGRMLYYDARLSKNHDVSCNSCHLLDRFGVDGEPTSAGHRGQRGDRQGRGAAGAQAGREEARETGGMRAFLQERDGPFLPEPFGPRSRPRND